MSKLALVTCSTLFALASSSVLGCALDRAAEGEGALGSHEGAVEGVAKIRFDSTYRTTVEGALQSGGKVTIAYDPARLTTCRGEEGGRPQWGLSLVWRLGTATGQPPLPA